MPRSCPAQVSARLRHEAVALGLAVEESHRALRARYCIPEWSPLSRPRSRLFALSVLSLSRTIWLVDVVLPTRGSGAHLRCPSGRGNECRRMRRRSFLTQFLFARRHRLQSASGRVRSPVIIWVSKVCFSAGLSDTNTCSDCHDRNCCNGVYWHFERLII